MIAGTLRNLLRLFYILLWFALVCDCFKNDIIASSNMDKFAVKQNASARVAAARIEKSPIIAKLFKDKNIEYPAEIYLQVFKYESELELWARSKSKSSAKFVLLKIYNISATSGLLGPKRKSGDLQIPEGFYYIDRFNPVSNFHLSLGINYPNESDRILGDTENLGGDIFIHGGSATVGCIPIGDDNIKELYIIALDSKIAGQRQIQTHIFPCRMTTDNYEKILRPISRKNAKLKKFWDNLKDGFVFFMKNRITFNFEIDNSGKYIIKE